MSTTTRFPGVFLLRLVATLLAAGAMLHPLLFPAERGGFLGTLATVGTIWVVLAVAAFLVGIFFYCRSLETCLQRVSPAAVAMLPWEVWLMFVPFYNIIADFFIIRGVTRSLEAESHLTVRLAGLRSFGAFSGYGWCVAQVLALVPTTLGEIAGLVALALWLVHWRFIATVNRRLGAPQEV